MKEARDISITQQAYLKMREMTLESNRIEIGGLLYGRVNPKWAKIYDVSGPGPNAKRTNNGVSFDLEYLLNYTENRLKEDLFVLGTWNTHPPNSSLIPSHIDIETMSMFVTEYKKIYSPIFCISGIKQKTFYSQFYEMKDGFLKIVESRKQR